MANLFTLMALLCWIPISAALFLWLPIARALSISYVAGWLLLPFVSFRLPGVPDFGKATAILMGSFLGLLLHKDARRVLGTFRLSWIDVPACFLCIGALVTSLLNGLGLWDGASMAFGLLCIWIGPYLLARIVYRSVDDLRELAKAILLGGLLYVPLCLFEIRMSPQLHNLVYGFSPRGWGGTRFGGYRPSVFMECGLELGMWMTATCLVGFVLWHQGRYRRFAYLPVPLLLCALLATTLLCKSTGALILLVLGLACWAGGRLLQTGVPLSLLVISSVAYMIIRAAGLNNGGEVVDLARRYINEERAHSLASRLEFEDLLMVKAYERPWFGWGGWGRSRVFDDFGTDISITDGRWIIIFGMLGLIGLLGTYGTLLFPCLAAIHRYGGQLCCSTAAAPVAALIAVVAVFSIDSLLNNFANPIYLLSAGAVGSVAQGELGKSLYGEAEPATIQPCPALRRHSWPLPIRKLPVKPKVTERA